MRSDASILHLDLDAFFASVEQRDKPSLRGKPVAVGGISGRGVVSTASYEARRFGVHSALATSIAKRRCPHGHFLSVRMDAYRQSSKIVMAILRQLSPVVEPLSIDEAYVDLRCGDRAVIGDLNDRANLERIAQQLRADIYRATDGLTASVGISSSKFMAKIASEEAKPNGVHIVMPGTELDVISGLPIRALPGVGPATADKLYRIGITEVRHVQLSSEKELIREIGRAAGSALYRMAFARDDREVIAEREAKSISIEDTFAEDITSRDELASVLDRDSAIVVEKLVKERLFARTVTVKVKFADFSTITRSRTLTGATDDATRVAVIARHLLDGVDVSRGVRLAGVGVSNFAVAAQEELFPSEEDNQVLEEVHLPPTGTPRRVRHDWVTGMEVTHPRYGRGWVWGAGLGRVTVRFESRLTGVGRVRTLWGKDPELTPAELLPLPGDELVQQ